MTPSQEAREYPLQESLVIEAAKSCGLECDRLSQLFDFTERVVRMARTPMLSADGGEDIPLSRSYVDADRKARQQEATDLEELRRAICGIGIVGRIDGHELIRRDSVIDLIDRRRHADR